MASDSNYREIINVKKSVAKAHAQLLAGMKKAMGEAIRETVREHKLLGYPIVVWKDGRVVWVPPEEIVLDEKENGPPLE